MTRPSARRRFKIGATVFMAFAWLMLLRPTWLGGPATFVLVRGTSMLPAYQNGDLLFALAQPNYSVGNAVAYRVPAGDVGAGRLVIHRIIDIEPDGTFVFQGDNNSAADPWNVTSADIVGSVVVRLPGVGGVLTLLLSPAVLGSLAAAVAVMALIARSGARSADDATKARRRPARAWSSRLRARLAVGAPVAHVEPGDS